MRELFPQRGDFASGIPTGIAGGAKIGGNLGEPSVQLRDQRLTPLQLLLLRAKLCLRGGELCPQGIKLRGCSTAGLLALGDGSRQALINRHQLARGLLLGGFRRRQGTLRLDQLLPQGDRLAANHRDVATCLLKLQSQPLAAGAKLVHLPGEPSRLRRGVPGRR